MRSTYQRKVDKKQIPTCNIMGVNIAAINMEWLLEYLDKNLDDIKGDYICVSNVHTTVTSYEHPSYCSIQNGGLMAIPDGGPLSSVGRKRGYQNMERTTGPSLMGEIFKISAEKGYRHYFYGSTEETLELLYKKLNENYPGIQIAGMYSPPFRSMTEEEEQLNTLDKSFIVNLFLQLQDQNDKLSGEIQELNKKMEVLIEQITLANKNRFVRSSEKMTDTSQICFMEVFRMIIGTKKVQIDYFVIRGFGENPTLYAWLTPKKEKQSEFSEVEFYVNSWNKSLINGRYCYEVHDVVFLQKLQVKHLPYDIDTQNIDESRRWIISPVNADQVIKCTNMGRKVSWQEFYDMVVSDEAYAMLIQWVTDHQSEERKYSKKEIYEAYREYLEEIYKYNLSDGTESSR